MDHISIQKNSKKLKQVRMKKHPFLLVATILLLSCNKTSKEEKTVDNNQTNSLLVKNSTSKPETKSNATNWYDPLLADYVKNSDNGLIKASLKNNEHIQWLLDRTEKTDSTNYYIFNIGQDVSDENNTNKRFSSDGWVYIDSISKKIYEYDLPNDSIIIWKKKHF